MKKILLITLLLPKLLFSQITLIPDSAFEQKLIHFGYDTIIDGQVFTSSINSVTSLTLGTPALTDLTGIEDFISLMSLTVSSSSITNIDISNNQFLTDLMIMQSQLSSIDLTNNPNLTNVDLRWNNISSIDLSNNLNLTQLELGYNQITNLDVSNNTYLTELYCGNNQLTDIDISNNVYLQYFFCYHNQITSLDLSNNPLLCNFGCSDNPIECLNYQNGNNINICHFTATNTNLTCVQVDDSTWSTNVWSLPPTLNLWIDVDSTVYYSNNCNNGCSFTNIDDLTYSEIKIYPNPVHDFINIESETPVTITLVDMRGKTIFRKEIENKVQRLNMSHIKNGIYLLNYNNKSYKLIKQ